MWQRPRAAGQRGRGGGVRGWERDTCAAPTKCPGNGVHAGSTKSCARTLPGCGLP
jgi:hypothetical protein